MRQPKVPLSLLTIALATFFVALPPVLGGDKIPARCVLSGVPYIEQVKNYCGPAALASVLRFWGLDCDQKTIGKTIFDGSLQATNGADMLLYARSKGYSGYSWDSSLPNLKGKLALGIPVIVLQDSSATDHSGHYRIATGYDDSNGVVCVNDPYEPQTKQIPYDKFEALWEPHGNWSLLICPPNRDTFKQELDQKNPVLHLDLAYLYYKRGELEASERESRTALALEPGNYSARDLLSKATRALGARSRGEKPKKAN
jgi:uncharacterized protein YvpB